MESWGEFQEFPTGSLSFMPVYGSHVQIRGGAVCLLPVVDFQPVMSKVYRGLF